MVDVIISSVLLYCFIAYLLRLSLVRMVLIAVAGFAMCLALLEHCKTQTVRDCGGRLNSRVLWPYRELTGYLLALSKNAGADDQTIAVLQNVSDFDISRVWLYGDSKNKTSYVRFVKSVSE